MNCGDVGTPKTVDQWFDTSCFANPAPFAIGTSQIGDVRGPGVFDTDVSAFKKTPIGTNAFELRIDVFNVFNWAHVENPGTTFGNSTFGRISATRLTPRDVQIGFRFLF